MTLGAVPSLGWTSCRNSYIDKLTFISRVKNSIELLEEAALVVYYPFDNSYSDAGPNNIMYPTFKQQAFIIFVKQTILSHFHYGWMHPFVNNGTILQVISCGNKI